LISTKIVLIAFTFFTFFYSNLSWSKPDFIEVQMKYSLLSSGKKDFSYIWDEKENHLLIRLGLAIDNFEEELHGEGFDLKQIEDSYLIFPDPPENCSYYKSYGSIQHPTDAASNEVFVEYKGPGCLNALSDFTYGTYVIHYYNVSSLTEGRTKTSVVRLQIWDNI
jgi:hypothetical protein